MLEPKYPCIYCPHILNPKASLALHTFFIQNATKLSFSLVIPVSKPIILYSWNIVQIWQSVIDLEEFLEGIIHKVKHSCMEFVKSCNINLLKG